MPRRLKLGIDLDGVLADFVGGASKIAAELGFQELNPLTWGLGLSEAQEAKLWYQIKSTKNFWTTLPPLGSGENVLYEADQRHILYFITSRCECDGDSIERQSARFIRDWFDVETPNVIVVPRPSQKIPLYNILELDAHLDDKKETIASMLNAKQNGVVFDQPWNTGLVAPRVKSLAEYFKLVEEKLG